MTPEPSHDCASVEQQIVLLRELACAFENAQQAIVAQDLEGFERQTGRQQALCRQLCALQEKQGQLGEANASSCGSSESAASQRWADLLQELALVQERVRHLNGVHAALLRRAQRSLRILANIFATSSGIYGPLQPSGGSSLAEFRR